MNSLLFQIHTHTREKGGVEFRVFLKMYGRRHRERKKFVKKKPIRLTRF